MIQSCRLIVTYYTPGRRGLVAQGRGDVRIQNAMKKVNRKNMLGYCPQAVHGQSDHQTDVEQDVSSRDVMDVLTFVRAELPEDGDDDGERLVRYLNDMEECIEYDEQEEQGVLVVSKKTLLEALPSTYLKDLSTLLRNAKHSVKPLFRKISGGEGHPPCMGSGEEILLQKRGIRKILSTVIPKHDCRIPYVFLHFFERFNDF